MKKKFCFLILSMMALVSYGSVPSFFDDFDGSLVTYSVGQVFTNTAVTGWQASGPAAYVTNNGGYSGNAVFLGETVALTNTLGADASLKIWTDYRVKPLLGAPEANPQTNASSLYYYFNTNGFVVVATVSGWQICTNDVWGNSVAPATNNGYVRVSVFQDYSTSTQAVFLNDQLIVQDMRFVGTAGTYNRLLIQNADSNCWLDNVWVKTNVSGLASNRNGDAMVDADEVQQFGHARRTLYVSSAATNLVPYYSSITNALAAWRPRDIIHVIAGNYSAENVALAANPSNVVFEGDTFSVNSLTVASNASVSIAQTFTCGTLSLTGQVAMVSGASLTSTTAHVVGSLSVSGGGVFVVTSLDVGLAGVVSFTSAQLVANAAGVVMNGTFAISNTWGTLSTAGMPLPFSDNFDVYAENTVVTNLKFRGWNASDGTVKIQTNVVNSGKAVVLPDGTILSNSISATGVTKVWTDFFARPVLGVVPVVLATNISSFLAYANTNGYLVVATAGGGWFVCSNQLDGALATPIQTNTFTRITVCQDLSLTPPQFAVFVASNLVAQGLSSPANVAQYTSFLANNQDSSAYLDDVIITATLPSWLTSDLNHNGYADAYEINTYGLTIDRLPRGTIYCFR